MWIYKITNTQNGKIYIGQSINPILSRWNRHINDAMSNTLDTHFARAIRKYGEKSFTVEEIDTATNQDELTKKESQWIKYYNSVETGYNETDAEYKCGGNTYKSKTPKEMEIIRDKIRKTKMGGNNPNSKAVKVTNIKTGEEKIFDSQQECADNLGLNGHHPISRRCTGKIKSLLNGIYKFEYYK